MAKTGTWIIKEVPVEIMRRTRLAAMADDSTIRRLIIDLVEEHLTGLERKGALPKSKDRQQ
jgi:hypothetical protein